MPVDADTMMIDLIKHFNAHALLVTHCSLGCINDTILSKRALEDNDIEHLVAFNCRNNDDSFAAVSEPFFLNTDFAVYKVDKNIDTICDVLYNQ